MEKDYMSEISGESEPKKSKKLNKVIYYIVITITALSLIALIVLFCIRYFEGRRDFSDYKNKVSSSNTDTVTPDNPINFEKIKTDYPNVCAWITVDGTKVDYPILQSSSEMDDNYYLDHQIDGTQKLAGAIYIQKRNHNDFNDPNTLIYGHNMLNGTMFGNLKKFRDKSFFEENRNIYIYLPGHILQYEIISAFVYDDRHIINSFNFDIESERMEFFNECINPTSFTKQVVDGASLTKDDKIITLSTCNARKTERYLVVGKLINDTKTN